MKTATVEEMIKVITLNDLMGSQRQRFLVEKNFAVEVYVTAKNCYVVTVFPIVNGNYLRRKSFPVSESYLTSWDDVRHFITSSVTNLGFLKDESIFRIVP